MFCRHSNLGVKVLAGLCLCVTINSCNDNSDSSNDNTGAWKELPPVISFSDLKTFCSEKNISDVSDEDLGMYENMSKALSEKKVKNELEQNYNKAKESKDLKEMFKKLSQQCQACATAVELYSEGKSIYSHAEDRDTLYENIFPEFSKMWSKNNNIDKKGTVEICLNRLKNNNKKIIENISKISMALQGILKQVDTNCANVLTDVTKIVDSLNKFKESFQKVLETSKNAKEVQDQLLKFLDGFSRNVTNQVESTNKKLNNQSSTLKKQYQIINAIQGIVHKSKNAQDDTNTLLGRLQKTVENLEKELLKNTQGQGITNKQNDNAKEEEGSDDDYGFGDLF